MSRPATFLFCLITLSCGDAPLLDGDAAVADATTDASVDANPDAASIDYFAPALLSELNTAAEERSPTLAADGLSIYFTREEFSGTVLVNVPYVARRVNQASQFRPPIRAAAFGPTSLYDLEMSDDELEWHFWRGLGQLAKSTRPNPDDGWSAPIEIGFDGFSPTLNGSGRTLHYIALNGDIVVRQRAARFGMWGAARTEPLVVSGDLSSIDSSRDGLLLLVTTDSGIFVARRTTTADDFDTVTLLFEGSFEDARFGADGQLISLAVSDGPNRQLAIATRR